MSSLSTKLSLGQTQYEQCVSNPIQDVFWNKHCAACACEHVSGALALLVLSSTEMAGWKTVSNMLWLQCSFLIPLACLWLLCERWIGWSLLVASWNGLKWMCTERIGTRVVLLIELKLKLWFEHAEAKL